MLGKERFVFHTYEKIYPHPIPSSFPHADTQHTGIGVFQGYYESVLLRDYSATTVSWIPSLQIFFMFFSVSAALSNLIVTLFKRNSRD